MNKLEINYSSDYMYNEAITEDLVDQVHNNEIKIFKENINKMQGMVYQCRGINHSITIRLIIALINFDLENADTPHSEMLKSSFRFDEEELNPLSLVARVKEFYELVKELFSGEADDFMFTIAIESALALHKNRVLTHRSCALSNYD